MSGVLVPTPGIEVPTELPGHARIFGVGVRRSGRSLTAKAWVLDGTGKGGRDLEITLNAMPMWEGQSSIDGLNIETTPEFIPFRRTGRAHVIGSDIDGGWGDGLR
jgi:hypothetical protein